jgi:hypothetical protein
VLREGHDHLVAGDRFAVAHAFFDQFRGGVGVDVDGGDDEGAEEVALAALVDAHVRGVKLRVELGFVAEAGGAEDLRFEGEFDPFPGALALDDHFTALVERDVAVGKADGAGGVGDGEGFVLVGAQFQQEALLLGGVEGEGVGGTFGGHGASLARGGRICQPKRGRTRREGRPCKMSIFFHFTS